MRLELKQRIFESRDMDSKAPSSDSKHVIDLTQSFAQLKASGGPFILFLLTFATIAAVISLTFRSLEPTPDFLVLSPKLNHFQNHHETYNAVFLGTSRTFYHIVPDEVEQAASEAGCAGMKVYNFGVFGLTGAEQDWIVSQILETPDLALTHLILEDPLPAERSISEVTSERSRYFHQPALYRSYLENIVSFPEHNAKRAFRAGVFGYGVLHDLSGVGRLSKAIFPPAKQKPPFDFNFELDGFEVLGSRSNADIEARRADFQSNPNQFTTNLAGFDKGPESNSAARAQYHIQRLERIQNAGIQTGLFISPDTQEVRRTPWIGQAVKTQRPDMSVFNFNQPSETPVLFQREHWFDFSHLNETGAILLSQSVGRQLCAESKTVK